MTEQGAIWLTVSQAAIRLGRSERTVRRWVDLGRLPIDKTKTPFVVNIEGEVHTETDTPDTGEPSGEVARLQELLHEIRADRDYLRQALATALSTQAMIEAPKERLTFWQRLGLAKVDTGERE
jgi:hypothetical protein